MAHAIEVAGIKQSDTRIERGVDRGDALASIRWTIQIRHAHAAKSDDRDLWTYGAEPSMHHRRYSIETGVAKSKKHHVRDI